VQHVQCDRFFYHSFHELGLHDKFYVVVVVFYVMHCLFSNSKDSGQKKFQGDIKNPKLPKYTTHLQLQRKRKVRYQHLCNNFTRSYYYLYQSPEI